MVRPTTQQAIVPQEAIERQIKRLLTFAPLAHAPRLADFLRYVVEETVAGRGAALKQYTIAVRGLGLPASFDPDTTALIRVHARRLRQILDDYYRTVGQLDPVLIQLNEGSYQPHFAWNTWHAGVANAGEGAPAQGAGLPTIAVVSFANLGMEGDWRYFPAGLTEEIMMRLAQSPDFAVMGPFDRSRLQAEAVELHEVGMRYGALYVLDGSVQRDADLLRVRVRLLDGATGAQVWGNTYQYDAAGKQLLTIEQEIVAHVGRLLGDEFGVVNRHLTQRALLKPIPRLTAYEAILRARLYLLHLTEESLFDSIAAAEHAVQIMPDAALAWALLGALHAVAYIWPIMDRSPLPPCAVEYAERALMLNQNDPWVLIYAGLTKRLAGDPEGNALFRRLLARPCPPVPLGVAGAMNVYAKIDNEQSLELIHRAQALNPHYPRFLHYGTCLIYLDQGEDARALAELDAQDVRSHYTDPLLRAAIYCRAGSLTEARVESERVVRIYPNFPARGFSLLARYHHRDYLDAIYQRLAPLNLPWTPPPAEQPWLQPKSLQED